jgi:cytochrome oxidase assembly protein ShyY1
MTLPQFRWLFLMLLVEAALFWLAGWQWHRYHQHLSAQAGRNGTPRVTVSGKPLTFAWFTNQPSPADGETAGRRLIVVLQTAHGLQLADLGWQRNPPDPAAPPDFSAYEHLDRLTVTGVPVARPVRHGALRGPATTTHRRLLAFLDPSVLTSATLPPTYLLATQVSPGQPTLITRLPPLRRPMMNLSYALQWLVMALVFPLLCWGLWRKSRAA